MLAAVSAAQSTRVGGLLNRFRPNTACAGQRSPLEATLQQVTHSQCAAVPREALEEAVRLALENEESLAVALRHIEENLVLPACEWRRMHGALALLEHLLQVGESDGLECGSPIGSCWFEAKVDEHLKILETFSHPEDSRVAMLVRRAAAAVRAAAKKHFKEEDAQAAESSSSRRGNNEIASSVDLRLVEADGPDAAAGIPKRTAEMMGKPQLDLRLPERKISQSLDEKAEAEVAATEAAKRAARSAAAKLEALSLPQDLRQTHMPSALTLGSAGSPATAGQGAPSRPSVMRRFCACLWGGKHGAHAPLPTAPPGPQLRGRPQLQGTDPEDESFLR
mmetsp:Transcript_12982/g.29451  ORF Transcript_12982/g.29451 Transcript_12982/m.29451 type:complete len:336 (+) Transcript_12982:74-1081(+)